MFLPVAGSKKSGKPCSVETMLRDQAAPHWGWSDARRGKHQHPSTNIQRTTERGTTRPAAATTRAARPNPLDALSPSDVLRAGTSRAPFIELMLLFFGDLILLASAAAFRLGANRETERRAALAVLRGVWCNRSS